LTEANEEAARVTAQTAMKSRQMVANAKVTVLNDIVEKARGTLATTKTTRESMAFLINNAIGGLGGSGKVALAVSQKDVDLTKEIVKADKRLSELVLDVSACDCTGGVLVQAAYWVKPLIDIHQVQDDFFTPVPAAGDIPLGLVEHDIDRGLIRKHRFSGHRHLILFRIDLRAQFGDGFSVYGHQSLLNIGLSHASGADPGLGEVFLQANHLNHF